MASGLATKSLSAGHSDALLLQLNGFRQSEQFTDVTLICNDVRIPAHRNVLAAASPYFMAMFSGHFPESDQREIHMQEMDARCLQLIIDFVYTGHLEVTEDCTQQLLATASFLQLEQVSNLCAEYMAYLLDADNCLGLKHFAEKHNNFLLLEAAKDFIVTNFQDVVQAAEFFEMTYAELVGILCNDELYVHSDDTVLCGLVRWAEHRPEERLSRLGTLLRFIHPACVSAKVARSLSLLQQDAGSRQWLQDVQQCEGNVEWHVFVLDKMGRSPDMQRFDTDFKISTPLKPLPRPAFAVSLAAYKNILYVQGGSTGRSTRESFYYNIYRDQWYSLSPLLMERSHHRSLLVNECLYALGGNSLQGASCSVECLNLGTNKAAFKENMLAERSSMGAVVYGNSLYVMGGETDRRSLQTVEHYDTRIGHWFELPSMMEVNSYCTSAVIGESIYCCEGLGSCLERFDLRANGWQIINFWEQREFYEIFAVDNKLYSVSGDSISRYDADGNTWLTVYEFPAPREWDTAVGMQMMNCSV